MCRLVQTKISIGVLISGTMVSGKGLFCNKYLNINEGSFASLDCLEKLKKTTMALGSWKLIEKSYWGSESCSVI